MNGEIQDREKTMRRLKKVNIPILTGYQIYLTICDRMNLLLAKHPPKNAV